MIPKDWLYAATNCATNPTFQDPVPFEWHEVSKVQHYWLEVNAMTRPMMVREPQRPYETGI